MSKSSKIDFLKLSPKEVEEAMCTHRQLVERFDAFSKVVDQLFPKEQVEA